MQMPPVKIILANSHTLFRKGMSALLGKFPELQIVGEASDGQKTLDAANCCQADILLLDLEIPVINGYAVLNELKKRNSPIKVLAISTHHDEHLAINAIEAGSNGFITQNADFEELLLAIQCIATQGFYVNDLTSKAMLQHLTKRNFTTVRVRAKKPFSIKELEVLRLLSEELTNKEIAHKLYLSPRTVEGLRQKMIHQVGAKTTVGLLLYAVRNRIINLAAA